MLEMWIFALGVSAGCVGAVAYNRRMRRVVDRERAGAERAAKWQAEQRKTQAMEMRRTAEELDTLRQQCALERAERDGWADGYTAGMRDAADRTNAEAFLQMVEGGQRAAIMMRRRQYEHGKQSV